MTFRLVGGDAIEAMQAMAENSVDAIVTDPPYGLEFMGKEWDALTMRGQINRSPDKPNRAVQPGPGSNSRGYIDVDKRAMQEWHHAWATEALRILKPGGHLLAFGGTRTYHRLACAIEDAGFEIRDCLAWMYGSGFPKSLDVSKAIDKANGVTDRPVTGEKRGAERLRNQAPNGKRDGEGRWGDEVGRDPFTHGAVTPEAQRWNGWGTALKPAFEPIVLARKPLSERNVAANVQRWGTGALNIDGCRIGEQGEKITQPRPTHSLDAASSWTKPPTVPFHYAEGAGGRWPANVTLDETAAAMLDEQTGELTSGSRREGLVGGFGKGDIYGDGMTALGATQGDKGGASRFFYCPKADREERNRGVYTDAAQVFGPGTLPGSLSKPMQNTHPTVKPVELMRWLCRMVTPKGGTVLDPFTGSGSTGVAAMREGFEFIGVEREAEYVEIARARIVGDAPLFNLEAVGGGPTE